ncbi:MAG: hypothetical protein EBZ48_12500 [Proteobacteria bacterium]|nr:hypothetical protein [Pseudomonadota bacterium]
MRADSFIKVFRNNFYLQFLTATLIGCAALVFLSFDLPTWSEEKGWLEIGKSIASGLRWNPITPKSDYPSSFQAFPIGLGIAFGLEPIAASRLVAILYAVAGAFFLGSVTDKMIGGSTIAPFIIMVMSLLTYSTAFFVMTGWHEVTHVNFLCGACTYFLFSLLYDNAPTRAQSIGLGVFAGLSLWTLYTPALTGGASILAVLFLSSRHLSWKLKRWTLGTLAVVTAPLLLAILHSNGTWLHRHFLWFVRGGEWPGTQYSDQKPVIDSLIKSAQHILGLVIPQGAGPYFDRCTGVFPEWTLAVMALIGLIVSFCDWKSVVTILGPFAISLLALITSHATPWRVSILGFHILALAAIGVATTVKKLKSREVSSYLLLPLGCLVVLIHFMLFTGQIRRSHAVASEKLQEGWIANDVYRTCRESLRLANVIAVPDHYSMGLLQAILPEMPQFIQVSSEGPRAFNLYATRAAFVLSLDKEEEEGAPTIPASFNLECYGRSHGYTFRLLKKTAPLEKIGS